MKLLLLSVVLLLALGNSAYGKKGHIDVDFEDNDFAEFEDFEDEEVVIQEDDAGFPVDSEDTPQQKAQSSDRGGQAEDDDDEDDTVMVETEDDEFEHFNDDEMFEGFDKETRSSKGKSHDVPDLKIAKVPIHLRTNWDSFYMEMLMLAGLGAYFLNFLAGKTKNSKLAQAWLAAHKQMLEENFSIVGDDGQTKEATSGTLMKESENVYALWCSGRTCVEGMLVELKLIKRQDLISVMSKLFKPASDQIVVTVDMDAMGMDKFCLLIAQKKICQKMAREQNDLAQFTEKKNTDKFNIPSSFQLMSEIGEATLAVLDKKMCTALDRYEKEIEYIHFSDQYSGAKSQTEFYFSTLYQREIEYIHFSDQYLGAKSQTEDQQTKMPEVRSVLIFCFNVPGKGKTKTSDMENMKSLFHLVFYCMEKVGRLTLSKESRQKAERNRQKAEETFLKSAHAQRQEAAQLRREEKRRAEKEKMMNEEDPEKTRKWEERESKRDMKRKQPKMKMMKC